MGAAALTALASLIREVWARRGRGSVRIPNTAALHGCTHGLSPSFPAITVRCISGSVLEWAIFGGSLSGVRSVRVLGFDLPASSADVALAKLTMRPPSNATGGVLRDRYLGDVCFALGLRASHAQERGADIAWQCHILCDIPCHV